MCGGYFLWISTNGMNDWQQSLRYLVKILI
ncbi:MAG: hypothetical protein XD65_0931, partial [Caldanaerobacter subterraneus]